MLIGTKKIDLTILSECLSTTGKYRCFYGHHWTKEELATVLCFDVGVFNLKSGEVVRRHYKRKEEAVAFWDTFRESMTEPPKPSEEEEAREEKKLVWLN